MVLGVIKDIYTKCCTAQARGVVLGSRDEVEFGARLDSDVAQCDGRALTSARSTSGVTLELPQTTTISFLHVVI